MSARGRLRICGSETNETQSEEQKKKKRPSERPSEGEQEENGKEEKALRTLSQSAARIHAHAHAHANANAHLISDEGDEGRYDENEAAVRATQDVRRDLKKTAPQQPRVKQQADKKY